MPTQREHTHHGPVAEIVGFACRGLLLAAAAGLVLLVAWQSLMATIGVSRDVRVRFAQPDVLCMTGIPYCSQPGVLIGQGMAKDQPAVLGIRQAGPVRMGRAETARAFNFYWPGCEVGLTPGRFFGAPYSPLAFQQRTARVRGIPTGTPVALIDARLMPDDPNEPDWAGLIEACRRRGEAALFVVGGPDCYIEALARRDSDPAAQELPLLYRVEKAPFVVRRTAAMIGGLSSAKMIVVTGDRKLAESTARAGYHVRLIAPSGEQPAAAGRIVMHASLRGLEDSLRNGP